MGWLNFEDKHIASGVNYRQFIAHTGKQLLYYNPHPHPYPVRCHAQSTAQASAWL
jgi:hypothetical protein